MCMWFWYNTLIFSHFFCCVNFTWNAIKVYRQRVPCGRDSSYSFPPIDLKLCRCFLHGIKIGMWFGYNTLNIFSHFFCFVNLVFYLHEMLSKCIDSEYLVGATPLTVFHRLFWNFADVFCMKWKYASGFGIILWLFFLLFLLCELSVFFLHEILSKCINRGYLVGATPLTVLHYLFWNFSELFCMEWRCACGFGIILG